MLRKRRQGEIRASRLPRLWWATANAEASFSASFESSRLRIIQDNLLASYFGQPIVALITAFVMHTWHPWWLCLSWAAAFTATSLIGIHAVRALDAGGQDAQVLRRRQWLAGGLLSTITGCWSLLPLIFWMPGDDTNNMLMTTMLGSSMPLILAISAVTLRAATIHLLPVMIAMVLTPMLIGTAFYFGVAALSLVYCILMATLAVQINASMCSALIAREQNTTLMSELASAKADSDSARYRAERANKAKSTFLANMSHELRTPLNAIMGFSEVIKSELLGPVGTPTYREYAGDIHACGSHLLGLINDILDLSRIEAGRLDLMPHIHPIDDSIDYALRLVEQRVREKNLRVRKELPDEKAAVFADERAMRQILVNLLTNAVKFTPDKGAITVRVELPGETDEAPLVIAVIDTGIGIKAEDIPKVMEAFGQSRIEDLAMTAASEQGTGLGLPIVRGLTEAHGGRFSLSSTPGKGTTARIELPASLLRLPMERTERELIAAGA